ncbi:MAG TPA: heat-inducible transcriptional repressor HrcA [Bacilli bacterium]|nr:heat-inducible transcriptional repressor HrcA [Bacilli bacterium]
MIGKRQNEILKIIVEEYIKTAKPVGSKSICKKLDCSSATIRNEMALLEDLGFLEKTHISSGRVPSEKGYKYYVDNLMKPKELTGEEVLNLQTIMNNNSLEVSDIISKSVEIISEMTNYTSLVLGNNSSVNRLKKVETVPINDSMLIAIIVTDRGHIENKTIRLDENIRPEEIKKMVDLINGLLVDTPIDEINKKLEFEIKPIIGKYIKQQEMIYNVFYNAFSEMANKSNYHFSGKTNILSQPEFSDADKIKEIVGKFENKDIISGIEETCNGVNVYIGDDSKIDKDVTVVKMKYNINGEEGTIAVIGPKRMEYDKVIGMLEYIKKELEEKNNEVT